MRIQIYYFVSQIKVIKVSNSHADPSGSGSITAKEDLELLFFKFRSGSVIKVLNPPSCCQVHFVWIQGVIEHHKVNLAAGWRIQNFYYGSRSASSKQIWIRIKELLFIWIHADPDPNHCKRGSVIKISKINWSDFSLLYSKWKKGYEILTPVPYLLFTPVSFFCSLLLLLTSALYSSFLLLLLTPAPYFSSLLLLFTPAPYACFLLLLLTPYLRTWRWSKFTWRNF